CTYSANLSEIEAVPDPPLWGRQALVSETGDQTPVRIEGDDATRKLHAASSSANRWRIWMLWPPAALWVGCRRPARAGREAHSLAVPHLGDAASERSAVKTVPGRAQAHP